MPIAVELCPEESTRSPDRSCFYAATSVLDGVTCTVRSGSASV
jgi:hypothetical protein